MEKDRLRGPFRWLVLIGRIGLLTQARRSESNGGLERNVVVGDLSGLGVFIVAASRWRWALVKAGSRA